MKEIIELVNQYSNDMELGKQVRKLYYEHQQKIEELQAQHIQNQLLIMSF